MKIIFYLAVLIFTTQPCLTFGQFLQLDKARENIYNSKTDQERLTNLLAIGKFRNSMHGDTIYRYAQWAKKLAVQLNDNKNLARAEYNLVSSDLANGKTDSVLQKIDNNPLFKNIKQTDTFLYYKLQLLKANALNRTNNRTAALELQFKLLTEAEKEGNINAQLFALNYIGATYLNVNQPLDARQTWLRGIQIIKEKSDSQNEEIEAYILSNLALYYFNNYFQNHTKATSDSLLTYVNKAITLSTKNENYGVLASSLSLRGSFFGLIQQFEKGEKDIKDGLEIRKKIGDPLYIVNDFIGLSNFYLSQKEYAKCITVAKEGIAIADNNGIKGEQLQLITILGNAYKTSGDYKQYSSTLERFIAAADSNNRVNAADKIADIQTKYEVQKKETLIAKQQLDLWQRKFVLYGGGIITALLLAFLFFRFKKYQRQQKLKVTAMMEEEKRQHDVAVKDAEERERKRIAAELHDNLGVQANAILYNSSLLNEAGSSNIKVVMGLQETAKEMLVNLRETLWAMKAADVAAIDLWFRIINFMKQMGRHYTQINFKIEGVAPDNLIISSSRALHIVLVLQEAVNNSVKHASAATITATSIYEQNMWQIKITDDGQGFELSEAKQKTDSYGLLNMQQRAKEGNFKYDIKTVIGKGTTTTILINS